MTTKSNTIIKSINIGKYHIENPVFLAPMAGVTDLPFRKLCKKLKAGIATTEMVNANSLLYGSEKTLLRASHDGEPQPRSVQIAGGCPDLLTRAAKFNVERGAQLIDINMGCPAKKVCNTLAGSALLRDEKLVKELLTAVVAAVDVPVTLKIRTGWCKNSRNGTTIARMAEDLGIKALAVHGRTKACAYKGEAEYDTIAQIKESINIPVIANGDITTPEKAKFVLEYTKADGVMIGRAAQGKPWIFREVIHYLRTGEKLPEITNNEIHQLMTEHLNNLYIFYGAEKGAMIARKHVGWYCKGHRGASSFRSNFNLLKTAEEQLKLVNSFFLNIKDNAA